jgi:hypothetical protein
MGVVTSSPVSRRGLPPSTITANEGVSAVQRSYTMSRGVFKEFDTARAYISNRKRVYMIYIGVEGVSETTPITRSHPPFEKGGLLAR